MPLNILNVAEKPSVAKAISEILGRGNFQTQNGRTQYNKIYQFSCDVDRQRANMKVTSVLGHLMEMEFAEPFGKNWSACHPLQLFDAPVEKRLRKDLEPLGRQLAELARQCQSLILRLDCDREGENIAFEVIGLCRKANPRLRIRRARFSALIPREIFRALETLQEPNINASNAVDVRQEIDLRLGAAFTRFQTRRLQSRFHELADSLVSYGPCQFPTLGFVVERFLRRENFQQEPFWYITLEYTGEDGERASFQWRRDRLYDMQVCFVLYNLCVEDGEAVITSVTGSQKTRWQPFPLATVELQKRASRFLRMRSETTMKIAEELYQQGLISYPRTETDRFSTEFDIRGIIGEFATNPTWGAYAQRLLSGEGYSWPRAGTHDDQAHPPITPMKSVDPSTLSGDHRRIYELVTKHFLACCSAPAIGHQTVVDTNIGGENFRATGLMITERNWLMVYAPWEQWSTSSMPTFHQGQTFTPSDLLMKEGLTQPPQLLNEAELISEMDRNGIGTDATIAEHIKKIQEREYVQREANDRFCPTMLGLALVEGYRAIGYRLDEPSLRAAQESDVDRVARGELRSEAAIDACLTTMKAAFETCLEQAFKLDEAVGQRFAPIGAAGNSVVLRENVSACGGCGGQLSLRMNQGGEGGGGGAIFHPGAFCTAIHAPQVACFFRSKVKSSS